MGMFQPAVLSTAVWQDFLPLREFHVNSAFAFLTTATARYPWTREEQVLASQGPVHGLYCSCVQPKPTKVKKHHQAMIPPDDWPLSERPTKFKLLLSVKMRLIWVMK